jgi:hypothetical protein
MEACSWCGIRIEESDGFRAYEPAGERRALFCRLEHVVPWSIQGPHWEAGGLDEPGDVEASLTSCSHCGAQLDETRVLLVRHRGEFRVGDGFCSSEHLGAWAKAGGRWQ